ncbi:MAG: exodeoxyribonuclease VII small subunit [Caldilineaceae bacterium]
MSIPPTPASAPSSDALDLSYEEAFSQLEEILSRLEGGDLPLEESLSLFEKGSALVAHCSRKLEEAELRVRQWAPGDQTSSFDGWQE